MFSAGPVQRYSAMLASSFRLGKRQLFSLHRPCPSPCFDSQMSPVWLSLTQDQLAAHVNSHFAAVSTSQGIFKHIPELIAAGVVVTRCVDQLVAIDYNAAPLST